MNVCERQSVRSFVQIYPQSLGCAAERIGGNTHISCLRHPVDVQVRFFVTPAKAGVQRNRAKILRLDSRRGNDGVLDKLVDGLPYLINPSLFPTRFVVECL